MQTPTGQAPQQQQIAAMQQAPLAPQQQQQLPMMQQAMLGQQQPWPMVQPPQALLFPFQQQQQQPLAFNAGNAPPFIPPMGIMNPSIGIHRYEDDDPIEEAIGAMASVANPEPDPVVSTEGPISVNTKVEYTSLPKPAAGSGGVTQEVFGLVTAQAAQLEAGAPTERQPMDIIAVLDISGSMGGRKIQQVQEATRFLISQADPRDRLSIVTFNQAANRALKLCKMSPEGKDNANVAVLRLIAGGGTSIAAGLSMGLDIMEQRRQKNKVASILLLTDGQDASTHAQLPSLIGRAERANSSVYAFGFGADHDARLLTELAEQARTPFSFVEDTEAKIREAFAGTVGGLLSVVAQDIKLTLKFHVQLKALHTPFVTKHVSDTETTVTILDVFAGERRDVLIELAVPIESMQQSSDTLVLLEAAAQYRDLRSGGMVQTPLVPMQIEAVQEPQPEQEPDEDVCVQRERVQVRQALKEAMEQGNCGNFTSAQDILTEAEQHLRPVDKRSAASAALGQQLREAHSQMEDRSQYERRGRSTMCDAMQMHSVQRCTNMNLSATSQGMYMQAQQIQHVTLSSMSS